MLIGLVITALLLWLFASYQRDIRAARERVVTGSEVVETPCGAIEYAVAGDGAPMLVVHGAGGGFDQTLAAIKALPDTGFRLIAMSRFGYLRTPLPEDGSPAAQADAHACLLDALNIERAAVFGVSAGTPSSLQFALRYPERTVALVLLVPAAYAPRAEEPPLTTPRGTQLLFDTALRSDFLFWAAIRFAPDTVFRAILATPPNVVHAASPEERARVQQMMEQILPVSLRRQGLLNDAAILTAIGPYELEQITAPTLTISAMDDLFGTYDVARYTAERIPDARFIGYEQGGHVWVGHHEKIMAEVAEFLSAALSSSDPAD